MTPDIVGHRNVIGPRRSGKQARNEYEGGIDKIPHDPVRLRLADYLSTNGSVLSAPSEIASDKTAAGSERGFELTVLCRQGFGWQREEDAEAGRYTLPKAKHLISGTYLAWLVPEVGLEPT
jgi:hypothetical protein